MTLPRKVSKSGQGQVVGVGACSKVLVKSAVGAKFKAVRTESGVMILSEGKTDRISDSIEPRSSLEAAGCTVNLKTRVERGKKKSGG